MLVRSCLLMILSLLTLPLYGEMIYIPEGKFYIDPIEVTNRQYDQFVKATGHCAPRYWVNGKVPLGFEEAPVVYVTFHDAEQYATWRGARIPTEEEWEIAAQWALDHSELVNFVDDDKKGFASGGNFPDRGTNIAEWTSSPFSYSDRKFKTIRRGFVENCCPGVPTTHRAPMYDEDCNISTGFRCIKS